MSFIIRQKLIFIVRFKAECIVNVVDVLTIQISQTILMVITDVIPAPNIANLLVLEPIFECHIILVLAVKSFELLELTAEFTHEDGVLLWLLSLKFDN